MGKPCPLRLVTYRAPHRGHMERLAANLSRQLKTTVKLERCEKCHGYHIRVTNEN